MAAVKRFCRNKGCSQMIKGPRHQTLCNLCLLESYKKRLPEKKKVNI